MKNHESRPTGSAPFPEVKATRYNNNNYGCGPYRDWECGHERRRFNYRNYNDRNLSNSYKPLQNKEKQERGKNIYNRDTKKVENVYY